jgi:hypothetical protein
MEFSTYGPYFVGAIFAIIGLLWAPYTWKRKNLQVQKEAVHELHAAPYRFWLMIGDPEKLDPSNLDLKFVQETSRETLRHLTEAYTRAQHSLPTYLEEPARSAIASLSKMSSSKELHNAEELRGTLKELFVSIVNLVAGGMVDEERYRVRYGLKLRGFCPWKFEGLILCQGCKRLNRGNNVVCVYCGSSFRKTLRSEYMCTNSSCGTVISTTDLVYGEEPKPNNCKICGCTLKFYRSV